MSALDSLIAEAAMLLGIATVGRGADPVEFDRRVVAWQQKYDDLLAAIIERDAS